MSEEEGAAISFASGGPLSPLRTSTTSTTSTSTTRAASTAVGRAEGVSSLPPLVSGSSPVLTQTRAMRARAPPGGPMVMPLVATGEPHTTHTTDANNNVSASDDWLVYPPPPCTGEHPLSSEPTAVKQALGSGKARTSTTASTTTKAEDTSASDDKSKSALSRVAGAVSDAMSSLVPDALKGPTSPPTTTQPAASSAGPCPGDKVPQTSKVSLEEADKKAEAAASKSGAAQGDRESKAAAAAAGQEEGKLSSPPQGNQGSEGAPCPPVMVYIDGSKFIISSQNDFQEKIGKFGAIAVKRKTGFFEKDDGEMIFDYRKLQPGGKYVMEKLPTLDRLAHPPGPSKPMDFTVNLNLNIQMESHTRVLAFYGMVSIFASVALYCTTQLAIAFIR